MNYIERYWRDATPQDAIKRPPMVARFRDNNDDQWIEDFLCGVDTENNFWFSKGDIPHVFWKFCQVYDAPDPGEGWRLVDIDNEKPQAGDEWLDDNGAWKKRSCGGVISFCNLDIYRRRITPAVTYVPFTWEDREQLRGRIITFVDRNRTVEFRCESFSVDDDGFLVNDTYAKWLCKNAVFVDTKEPAGKKVVQ